MKTNQVLQRTMGSFKVLQRTHDGMFNATELMHQWNESTGMKKNVNHFLENKSTKEFLEVLIEKESYIRNSEDSCVSESYDCKAVF